MPKIRIQGIVSYFNGSPVSGAKIKILDLDEDGRHDNILSATTDGQGRFSGLSKEWQDIRQMPFLTLPAFTDTMVLQFEVTSGSQKHTGPFIYVNDTTSVPIVVPWPWASNPVLVRINGRDITNAGDILSQAMNVIQSRQNLNIEVLDPRTVEIFQILTESQESILDWVEEKSAEFGRQLKLLFGSGLGSGSTRSQALVVEPVSGTAAITIIAVAVLVLVSGATAVAVGVAVSLVIAVSLGYCEIGVTQETEVGSDGQSSSKLDFGIVNCTGSR
jgi:hypothetical protein